MTARVTSLTIFILPPFRRPTVEQFTMTGTMKLKPMTSITAGVPEDASKI